jgi:hypothetical protein
VSEERSISSHVYDIGIALEVGHECSLQERSVEVVPLTAVGTVASILTGKHLRTLAVVVVVAVTLAEEPALGTVEVLVNEVYLDALHLGPQVVEVATLRVGARRTDNINLGMLLAQTLYKLLETYYIFGAPLLVTHTEELEVEGLGVTHLGTNLTILSGHVAIGKLDEVEGILDILIQVINCYVSVLTVVLILT